MTARAMTFFELISTLVVAGIALPALLSMWSTVSLQAMRSEGTADAAIYAQALMEEISSKKFDENRGAPWSSSLGREGEDVSNATNYDDVDDFIGTTDPRIIVPGPGYSRWAQVSYVIPNAADTWTVCPAPICSAVSNCTTCNECCYKRIIVNVKKDNLPLNISLIQVVAGY